MSSSPMQNIQNALDPLRRRYDSFSESERLLVNGVGILILLVLVFLVLIVPAQRSSNQAEIKLASMQSLKTWMQENEAVARAASSGNSGVSRANQPLQTIVTSTAPAMGITVKRFEPESDDKLRVWLEKVSFDKTMRWLHQLESRYGLRFTNIAVDAEREEGLVTVKLVLEK